MSKRSRTKLIPLSINPPGKEILEAVAESRTPERDEELLKNELDIEIECPRCNEIMELHSDFDELMYLCEGCNFLLKCA